MTAAPFQDTLSAAYVAWRLTEEVARSSPADIDLDLIAERNWLDLKAQAANCGYRASSGEPVAQWARKRVRYWLQMSGVTPAEVTGEHNSREK